MNSNNSKKVFVYDKPIVITQRFEVSLPNIKGRVYVIRKEIKRQAHNTACDVADSMIDYEVTQEVDINVWQAAVKAVEKEIKDGT